MPEKSHGDDNVDEVDQAIVMSNFTTPVLAGADPSICDSTVQPLNLSRKLSVLDTEKFLAEPISPIVNIDREEDGDNDSSRAALPAAVNSTFDTTGDAARPSILASAATSSSRGPGARPGISWRPEARFLYFPRAQGHTSVPQRGGSSLGMGYEAEGEAMVRLEYEGEEEGDRVEETQTQQRRSSRLSLGPGTVSTPALGQVADTWTSSVQKPGVIKLTKVGTV